MARGGPSTSVPERRSGFVTIFKPKPVYARTGMHARESDLAGPVRSFLEVRGYAVAGEVVVGGRRADLVGVGESIAAVELKLRDWRAALRQSLAYQLGAEYAWVAMPLATAAIALRYRDRFERDGVGLLGVIGVECRLLIEARRSPRFLPPLEENARRAWALATAWHSAFDTADGALPGAVEDSP